MELHDRVRYLRRDVLDMTQAEFAKNLGTSRDAINNIEGDRLKRPEQKEPLLKLMCEKFNISEKWLLTGEGEMRAPVSRQEEITKFVKDVMNGASDSDTQRILTALIDATPTEIAAIANFARRIAKQATDAKYESTYEQEFSVPDRILTNSYEHNRQPALLSSPKTIPGADSPVTVDFPNADNTP